jgi:hypothetical protein
MCDSLVAVGEATADGSVILAKNSDAIPISCTPAWTDAVWSTPVQHRPPLLFSMAWDRFNEQAGFVQG